MRSLIDNVLDRLFSPALSVPLCYVMHRARPRTTQSRNVPVWRPDHRLTSRWCIAILFVLVVATPRSSAGTLSLSFSGPAMTEDRSASPSLSMTPDVACTLFSATFSADHLSIVFQQTSADPTSATDTDTARHMAILTRLGNQGSLIFLCQYAVSPRGDRGFTDAHLRFSLRHLAFSDTVSMTMVRSYAEASYDLHNAPAYLLVIDNAVGLSRVSAVSGESQRPIAALFNQRPGSLPPARFSQAYLYSTSDGIYDSYPWFVDAGRVGCAVSDSETTGGLTGNHGHILMLTVITIGMTLEESHFLDVEGASARHRFYVEQTDSTHGVELYMGGNGFGIGRRLTISQDRLQAAYSATAMNISTILGSALKRPYSWCAENFRYDTARQRARDRDRHGYGLTDYHIPGGRISTGALYLGRVEVCRFTGVASAESSWHAPLIELSCFRCSRSDIRAVANAGRPLLLRLPNIQPRRRS
jgi:hypothetical protein